MTILPINGDNSRMGALFSTPKHLLLVDGVPALKRTIDYMSEFGPIIILAGEAYYDAINVDWLPDDCTVFKVKPTNNVIDTIRQCKVDFSGSLYIVDCDIVPNQINKPVGNTVYVFQNTKELKQYSNYFLSDGCIIDCNEKERVYPYAGSGIYYFNDAKKFFSNCEGHKSVSEVVQQMIFDGHSFFGDTDSDIFRLGTLPDITGGFTGNTLQRTMRKIGPTISNEFKWYEAYEDKKDIPAISGMTGPAMIMEYLEREGHLNIFAVIDLVKKYSQYRPLNLLTFESYITSIEAHLVGNPIHGSVKLIEALKKLNIDPTFAHGDLSVTNIIPTKEGHRLIDPLYSESKFGSYVLDYAKLLFSMKYYNNDLGNFDLLQAAVNVPPALIASECVRVCTYKKEFNFISENLINEL